MSKPTKTTRARRLSAELGELLASVSGRVIGEPDAHRTFVDLGFDSLLLTQLAQRVSATYGIPLRLRQLLEDLSSPSAIAAHLDRMLPADAPPVKQNGIADSGCEQLSSARSCASHPKDPTRRARAPETGPIDRDTCSRLMVRQLALMARQIELLGLAGDGTEQALEDAPPPTIRDHGVSSEIHLGQPRQECFTDEQRRHVDALVSRYCERTKASKAFTQKNRGRLADPGASSGFALEIKEAVYPIVVGRSSGARLWDLDGNEYLDLVCSGGSMLFGHSPGFLREALETQLRHDTQVGAQQPQVEIVAELFCELTRMDRVTFCDTASEALLGAVRVARAVTGRRTLVLFEGARHGLLDEVLVRASATGQAVPGVAGILPSAVENVLVLEYGTPSSLEALRARSREVAAVLVEPVQCARPGLLPTEFIRDLRSITHEGGSALVFDETVLGFRYAPGGAQGRYGVRADLAVYGSAMAAGLPLGALAGCATFMDAVDGGSWQYGDDSMPEAGVTEFVGPGARHPLSLAAAKVVLERLRSNGVALAESMEARALRFVSTLDEWLSRRRVPVSLHRFGSMMTIDFEPGAAFRDLLFIHLRDKGIHAIDRRPMFFSAAHTDQDVDFAIQQFQRSILELEEGGFIERPTADDRGNRPPLPGARLGRDASGNPRWFVPDPERPGMFQQVEVAP